MNEPTERQMKALIGILKKLSLTWDEVRKIIIFIDSQETLLEVVGKLKEKDFNLTPKETMNICYQVITEHLT